MNETAEFEALVHILWDKQLGQFVVHVPPQEVSKARVNADLSREELDETQYLHYMDIHSHNSMAAKFSPVDDQDEKATRLYAVLGRLDKFFPEITVRMSCGGTYCELEPSLVFESLGETFPREWRDNVKIGETQARREARIQLREVLKYVIFDGDVVEEKNLVRQNFTPADLGENKAQVLAERYSIVFGMETAYIPYFVETEERLKDLLAPTHFWIRRPNSYEQDCMEEMVILRCMLWTAIGWPGT